MLLIVAGKEHMNTFTLMCIYAFMHSAANKCAFRLSGKKKYAFSNADNLFRAGSS